MKTHFLCGGLIALLTIGTLGCSRPGAAAGAAAMGETVSVGGIAYVVVDNQWRSDLAGASGPRVPKNRFLLVRISASNGAGKAVTLPLLHLIDAKGGTHLEDQNGDGVDGWLGVLRTMEPGRSLEGAIVFDVPPGEYKLELVDDGELENQKTRAVTIPYRIDEPVKAPVPGMPQ
ncbi:MAG TPA: hypothetical protein DEH78_10260 [Solibacterales bacterium]|nr:hypothetical protein [Bryobacterales bacterium]